MVSTDPSSAGRAELDSIDGSVELALGAAYWLWGGSSVIPEVGRSHYKGKDMDIKRLVQ